MTWNPEACRKSSLAREVEEEAISRRLIDCSCFVMVGRSGKVPLVGLRIVIHKLLSSSCSWIVSLVLSGGLEAAVAERCRHCLLDMVEGGMQTSSH